MERYTGKSRRRRSRELALQLLYQIDMVGLSPEEALQLYYEHFSASPEVRPFAEELVNGVFINKEEIDRLIVSASKHWRLERMSIVDRNILRIALYEMLYCTSIPPKVSINEAIDLGKTFGNEDSGSFINGILDHLLPTLRREGRGEEENGN